VNKKRKIAVIGAGISGLSCAYYLSREYDVTVFESAAQIGGHTATKIVDDASGPLAVDTGFIVYNDWTYPNFIKLMQELGVQGRESEMSFSVTCEESGLEYAGSNLNTLFADRRNLLRPRYLKMLKDIVRFNRESLQDLEAGRLTAELSLKEYLVRGKYGGMFKEKYLVPMGAAIWSSTLQDMDDFPALFFVRFFKNHGLLSVTNRPQWHTLVGGSSSYLKPLTESFKDSIVTGARISKITRTANVPENSIGITYSVDQTAPKTQQFDALVFATHSDQALELLSEPTSVEQSILSSIAYRSNEVVLHTDVTRLPDRPLAWSSWNYRLAKNDLIDRPLAKLTYNMNILQGLESDTVYCVSLNQTDTVNPSKILGEYRYSHPVFNSAAIEAQARWNEIAGANNTWYCGAYWANGFHEDGVVSALRVVESINNLAEGATIHHSTSQKIIAAGTDAIV